MTVVVDASTVVAALVGTGPVGDWAERVLLADDLAAPHLLPVEVSNTLRREVARARLAPEIAALAHQDLFDLSIDLYPYEPFAGRVWELRENLTAYDAWYVALAEGLEASVATLDGRLAAAPGPACAFLTAGGAEPPG